MPSQLDLTEFKLRRVVCEVRYNSAYLIFDRTGRIVEKLKRSFPTLEVQNASPTASIFKSDEGLMGLEVAASRFTAENSESDLKGFSAKCKTFFAVVIDELEVRAFTRVGLRMFFLRSTKDKAESVKLLDQVPVLSVQKKKRFGVSDSATEFSIRWDSESMGVAFRAKAESGSVSVVLPAEFEMEKSTMQKEFHGLLLDIDYYTNAPVEMGQWDASVWIPQAAHIIKRECNQLLEG